MTSFIMIFGRLSYPVVSVVGVVVYRVGRGNAPPGGVAGPGGHGRASRGPAVGRHRTTTFPRTTRQNIGKSLRAAFPPRYALFSARTK